MENLVNVHYAQTGKSMKTNALGMREMQERIWQAKNAPYLIVKAPPASGKSRALMFVALDKLYHQGIRKAVVAVPERSIGASFQKTDLVSNGFFIDWQPDIDLTRDGDDGNQGKIKTFIQFVQEGEQRILICTHSTLRLAFDQMEESDFDGVLLAVDEFHHVSADYEASRLGNMIHEIMTKSTAQLIAMTGSYFRGDGVAVLHPDDEAKFHKVTYNYYDQLNGYSWLKTLGIGYHFYQGKYTSAIGKVLDTDKKTLIHIPNVNSRESTGDKYEEVDTILDIMGNVIGQDDQTGVISVRRKDGKILKVADLVCDDPVWRGKIVAWLRNMKSPDDIDIIIALGMAREGFDWPTCEHTLTVGYRGSLTEVVQIIGRCTRDSQNKNHAQFTNLIAQPDAEDAEVTVAVNDMLKAITCSLLMEQVLAPSFHFTTKAPDDSTGSKPGEIKILGFKQPSTAAVRQIVEMDLNDLKARILQNPDVMRAIPGSESPEVINTVLIPKIISESYPELSPDEVEEVRQYVVADSAIKNSEFVETDDRRFICLAGRFINIDELSIDLIDSINPFQKAFEILSKTLDQRTFRLIQECVESTRIKMTDELALQLYPKIKQFVKTNSREPDIRSSDPMEQQLASALLHLRMQRRKAGL